MACYQGALLFLTIWGTLVAFMKPAAGASVLVEMSSNGFVLSPDPLKVDTPALVISVSGNQGVGKSFVLKGLGKYFGISNADFESRNANVACTASIEISEISRDGFLLVDNPGRGDPSLHIDSNIHTYNIDLMYTKLIALVTGVLIHVSYFLSI